MIQSKKYVRQISRPTPDTAARADYFRFDRNERTTLFTEEEFQGMLATLTPYDFVAYGELEPFYLKITKWLNIDRDNILLTSGSDMGIKTIFETFIEGDDKVLVTLPNYAMFSIYTRMFGGVELINWYNKDLTLDVDSLLDNITEDIKLIIISNPGHSGKTVSESDLLRLIKKAKDQNSIIVIDEAYYHFYNNTMLKYIDEFDNLIITRTFSKAFGLASLRIGMLIACKSMIDELYRVKLIHEITGVAAKIGTYMLDHMNIVEDYVANVNKGKSVLYNRLPELGIEVFESDSNFVFFRIPDPIKAKGLTKFLETKNMYIKGPFSDNSLDGLHRVSVGDAEQMELFCKELENYYK